MPTMRPLFFEYPTDEATFAMDDQWMVGSDIVVKPVTSHGVTKTEIYLPGDQPWYDIAEYMQPHTLHTPPLPLPLRLRLP